MFAVSMLLLVLGGGVKVLATVVPFYYQPWWKIRPLWFSTNVCNWSLPIIIRSFCCPQSWEGIRQSAVYFHALATICSKIAG
jgi:hypothetical protein